MTKIIDFEKRKNVEGLLIPVTDKDSIGVEVKADLGIFLDEIEADLGFKVGIVSFFRAGKLIHLIKMESNPCAWIALKDGVYPKKDKFYLCVVTKKVETRGVFKEIGIRKYCNGSFWMAGYPVKNVTHYQELPDFPD